MHADAQAILSDLKAKREVHTPVSLLKDYRRTIALMAIYGAYFVLTDIFLNPHPGPRSESVMLYLIVILVVAAAIGDSQRALNRKFDRLVELLEKKGVL